LVIVAAHSLVSFGFLHSDEFSQIKVADERGFFNKLLTGVEYERVMPGRTASLLFATALRFRVEIKLKSKIPEQR